MRKLGIVVAVLSLMVAMVGVAAAGASHDVNGTACLVADPGGFDDGGFNAGALAGLEEAGRKLHVATEAAAAETVADLPGVIEPFVSSGECDLIIGVGFIVAGAMEPYVVANPDQRFAVVDFEYEASYDNVAELLFRVDEAAFLAGYIAAGISSTEKVGVYGGANIAPVTVFMDGYALGVEHYNQRNGAAVEVLGWDLDTRSGILLDFEFNNPDLGRTVTLDLFDQGADTVFAVAGGTGLGSLDAAAERKAAGQTVRVIEPDFDWFNLYGDPARVLLTSVVKKTEVAVFNTIDAFVSGTWQPGPVWEDLASGGVAIAPFHKTNNQVPGFLKNDLKSIEDGIIDGTIPTLPECTDPLGCAQYGPGDSIVIGAALALSGPLELLGLGELQGTQLALSQRGELFGRSLAVLAEDAQCTPAGGASAATALAADPAVAAIVGTTCSSSAFAAAPIITAGGYSMVSPSNTAPVLTEPGTHEAGYLRVAYNDRIQAQAMAGFAHTQLGASTAAIIRQDGTYEEVLAGDFTEIFTTLGGVISTEEVLDAASPDIGTAVTNVIAAGPPDLVYLLAFEPQGSEAVIAIRGQAALDGSLIAGSDGIIFEGFLANAGSAAEGVYATAVAPPSGPAYDGFAAAYQAAFGEPPTSVFDAYAFDATNMILDAVAGAGIVHGDTLFVGRQQLRDNLFATTALDGVTGAITCDPNGDCAAPQTVELWQVQGGQFDLAVP